MVRQLLMDAAERVPADRCLELGLFNRVFPDTNFRSEAFAFASELANGPSVAYGRMKQHLNAGVNQGLRESLVMEAEHMIASMQSSEAREAPTATSWVAHAAMRQHRTLLPPAVARFERCTSPPHETMCRRCGACWRSSRGEQPVPPTATPV